MKPIKLITHPKSRANFLWPNYMQHLFGPHFQLHRSDGTEEPGSIYVLDIIDMDDRDTTITDWARRLGESGNKVVIHHLWEHVDTNYNWAYYISNPNWFWYSESLWYDQLGYRKYQPDRTYQQLAFMPINMHKQWRDRVVQQLEPDLHNILYSYRDKTLPGDCERDHPHWQRYFCPDWYNSTYFSLVLETSEELPSTGIPFMSEKSFKPMAFQHPFQIHGAPGTLQYIQAQGFVTYDNLFDESYDLLSGTARTYKIQQNLRQFKQEPYTTETLGRIEHNYARFFDRKLVTKLIREEIVNPLREYAETR